MKIVIDTNILFSYFWNESFTKKLIENSEFELVSPYVSLHEIKKYRDEIIKKTGISLRTFSSFFASLKKKVSFVEEPYYSKYVSEVVQIAPDRDDADFLALALKEKTFLWSNDSALKKQDKVRILSTKEIIDLVID